eukprot:1505654-Pleurochrysis_carterae.AAC.1
MRKRQGRERRGCAGRAGTERAGPSNLRQQNEDCRVSRCWSRRSRPREAVDTRPGDEGYKGDYGGWVLTSTCEVEVWAHLSP